MIRLWHSCPGCPTTVARRLYACPDCWSRLPDPYRQAIAYNAGNPVVQQDAMDQAAVWFRENPAVVAS